MSPAMTLLEMLKAIEWRGANQTCPLCGVNKVHERNCNLQSFLVFFTDLQNDFGE